MSSTLRVAVGLVLICLACNRTGSVGSSATRSNDASTVQPGSSGNNTTQESPDFYVAALAARQLDYSMALREAALRLTGDLPTLQDIQAVASAPSESKKGIYEALVDKYVDDGSYAIKFTQQMLDYCRNTLRMGGSAQMDTAPAFCAQLIVQDRAFTDFFTATTGTCPAINEQTGAFAISNCNNGVTTHAGVLTNPAFQKAYFSNGAFRRVRAVQELFVCTKYPAEFGDSKNVGGGEPYTAPWPFESISGADNGGSINFHDTASIVCANCHATMNHLAPLFGRFDADGRFQQTIQVKLPLPGDPMTKMTDWLPNGEITAWRFGKPAADLPALGRLMADDVDVQQCTIARLWNFAFGKGDIVAALTTVPNEVIQAQMMEYTTNGFRLKPVIKSIFKSDDFVRF